jgi:hypothetical protein
MFLYCKSLAILYNRRTFDATMHQTRKKPLVTPNLPVLSYPRGWRCEAYYDQILAFGQVIHRKLHRQLKQKRGERRWFLSKPIVIYNPIRQVLTSYCRLYGRSYWRLLIARWLSFGYVRVLEPVITNKESQVLEVPGFRYLTVFNCIFR